MIALLTQIKIYISEICNAKFMTDIHYRRSPVENGMISQNDTYCVQSHSG